MAQYNVGDRVRVYIPGAMVLARVCQVTEIIEDNGIGESRYRVLWTSTNGLTTRYSPRDREMTLVARAAEPVPAPALPRAVVDPNEGNPFVPAPEPGQVAMENPAQEVVMNAGADALRWFGMNLNVPANEEIEAEARGNIENYRLNGVLPETFIIIGTRAVPVYDSVTSRGSIQREDYRPVPRNARFFQFRVPGNTLRPRYNAAFGVMEFVSVETGETWNNTFENTAVANIQGRLVDNIGIVWVTRADLLEHRRNVQGQAIPVPRTAAGGSVKRPKKKLRHKYKEMPKIREEKYYATKEYIA